MPLYATETIEVTNVPLDFDGVTVVTPTLLGSGTMTVTIIDSAVSPRTWVNTANMTYDSVRNLWYFLWNTSGATPVPAGTYTAKVVMIGANGTEAFNYLKIRLKAPPF